MQRRLTLFTLVVLCAAAATVVATLQPGTTALQPSASFGLDCDSPDNKPIPLGALTIRQICDSNFEVPSWQGATTCPSGQVSFRHGVAGSAPVTTSIDRVAYIDVDHSGEMETVVLISCGNQGSRRQVVILNRQASLPYAQPVMVTAYPFAEIFDLAGTATGGIRVQAGNYPNVAGAESANAVRQWLTFRQEDYKIQRIDNEQFPAHPQVSDLYLWAPTLRFAPLYDGKRTGLLTIYVTNRGSVSVPFTLTVGLPSYATLKVIPPECRVTGQPSAQLVCKLPGMSSDGLHKYELTVYATPEATISHEPVKWSMEASPDAGFADLGLNPNRASYEIWFE